MTPIDTWMDALADALDEPAFTDRRNRRCHSKQNHVLTFAPSRDPAILIREMRGLGWHYPDEHALANIAIGQGDRRGFGRYVDAQLPRIIELLEKRPYTRRALIQMTDYQEHPGDIEHMPVLISAVFRMQRDNLTLTVHARSMDLLLCLPVSYFQAAKLLEHVASRLRVLPGEITFFMNSAHVFADYAEELEALSKRHKSVKNPSVRLAVDG